MSAFVEKKTGFEGSRTLIHGGFCVWCTAGSIFAQDINKSYNAKRVTKVKSFCSGPLNDFVQNRVIPNEVRDLTSAAQRYTNDCVI
jgi:hypothetical protein